MIIIVKLISISPHKVIFVCVMKAPEIYFLASILYSGEY